MVAHAIIDAEDSYLLRWRWRLNASGYAVRSVYRPSIKRNTPYGMHRAVLGLAFGDPLCADHINGDKLDNRRANLRAVTQRQNQQNRQGAKAGNQSGFRGVCFNKRKGNWRAYVGAEYLGSFPTPEQAAHVAAEARKARGFLTGAERRAAS